MTGKEKAKFRNSPEWKTFRAGLLEERGRICEVCGIHHKSGLQIHHLDEANYTDLREHKFIVLCSRCHQLLEQLLRRKVEKFNIDFFVENFKKAYLSSREYK